MGRTSIFLSAVTTLDRVCALPVCSVGADSHQKLRLKNCTSDNPIFVTPLQHLRSIRESKGISIADVTRSTGLSYDNYIKYENQTVKEQYMCIETLEKLSELFQIDLLTDYHKFKRCAAEHIIQYMDEHHLTNPQLAEQCGVSITSVKQWKSGKCAPSYEMWGKHFK